MTIGRSGEELYRTYLEDGTIITHNDYEVIGRASDGVLVFIGNTDNLDNIYRYLENYPTPDKW